MPIIDGIKCYAVAAVAAAAVAAFCVGDHDDESLHIHWEKNNDHGVFLFGHCELYINQRNVEIKRPIGSTTIMPNKGQISFS